MTDATANGEKLNDVSLRVNANKPCFKEERRRNSVVLVAPQERIGPKCTHIVRCGGIIHLHYNFTLLHYLGCHKFADTLMALQQTKILVCFYLFNTHIF